ncbi:MAG TPA: hypothetical protein VGE88_07060 [Lysobacter sp.]
MSSVYRQAPGLRTDWFRILADLRRLQIFDRMVARRVGVSKGTVNNWKRGTEPRHSDGERLIALWCEATHQQRDAIPLIDPFDWRR